MTTNNCRTLLDVIENADGSYPGNLKHYYKVLFLESTNLGLLYHGLTHTNRVFWLCYQGGMWYREKDQITPRSLRNLLIAALFHDFNHGSKMGDDRVEINRAVAALRAYVFPFDQAELPNIERIIRATMFPHAGLGYSPSIDELIIRDADISQALELTWMEITLVGLGQERGMTPVEMLNVQEGFLREHVRFATEWGRKTFPQEMIHEKIRQVRQLQDILGIVREEVS